MVVCIGEIGLLPVPPRSLSPSDPQVLSSARSPPIPPPFLAAPRGSRGQRGADSELVLLGAPTVTRSLQL